MDATRTDADTETTLLEPDPTPTRSDTDRPPAQRPDETLPERTDSILDHHDADELPVTISHESVIEGDAAEALWTMYRSNFAPLETLAILQCCFERDEVLAELANPAITKIVGWQGTTPVGFAAITNDLESVPQISPRYLRAKYPDHVEGDRIYFGLFVTVSPEHRGMTLFNRLSLAMWQIPASCDGVLVFDICQFNRDTFDTDALVQRVGANFPGSNVEVIDQQTWYAATLPKPIPTR